MSIVCVMSSSEKDEQLELGYLAGRIVLPLDYESSKRYQEYLKMKYASSSAASSTDVRALRDAVERALWEQQESISDLDLAVMVMIVLMLALVLRKLIYESLDIQLDVKLAPWHRYRAEGREGPCNARGRKKPKQERHSDRSTSHPE